MTPSTWIDRYVGAFTAIKPTEDRDEYLANILNAVLTVSRARRGHGILMDGDTVLCEISADSSGQGHEVSEEDRKTLARAALGITRGAPDSTHLSVDGSNARICFRVDENSAGAINLEMDGMANDYERELAMAVALTLAAGKLLSANEKQARAEQRAVQIESAVAGGGVGAVAYLKRVSDLERDAIELALRTTNWNKEEAARRLGISRASIYMKVKKHGLQRPAP